MPHVFEYTLVRAVPRQEGAGPLAESSPGQRFRWLTAPRSTIVQTSPAHGGLTDDPAAELDRLMRAHVLAPE